MTVVKTTKKILTCKKEILEYLGVSEHTFRRYVSRGLPARYEDQSWMAHADNIEEWFRAYTRVNSAKVLAKETPSEGEDVPVKQKKP